MDKKLTKLARQNRPPVKLPRAATLFNVNRFGPLVFLLVFVSAGITYLYSSSAAPSKNISVSDVSMYITPAKQRVTGDQTLQAYVWIDAKDKPVNAVQAVITYPADKLLYLSSDSSSSQFSIQAETTNEQGRLVIARGSTTPLTGDQLVATITFKPLATSGQASVVFDASSMVLSSDTNTNILSRRIEGRYQLGN